MWTVYITLHRALYCTIIHPTNQTNIQPELYQCPGPCLPVPLSSCKELSQGTIYYKDYIHNIYRYKYVPIITLLYICTVPRYRDRYTQLPSSPCPTLGGWAERKRERGGIRNKEEPTYYQKLHSLGYPILSYPIVSFLWPELKGFQRYIHVVPNNNSSNNNEVKE